ncbi:MAG: hypothetical protein ACLRRT_08695 [Ruthenibacterium lactatiformans]
MKNLHQQVLGFCRSASRTDAVCRAVFPGYKTADYLEQALCELEGLELSRPHHQCDGGTAPGRPGRCLAIRADIDALPIRGKRAGLSLCNEGVMHACSHRACVSC